jgi:hypothetical protein
MVLHLLASLVASIVALTVTGALLYGSYRLAVVP